MTTQEVSALVGRQLGYGSSYGGTVAEFRELTGEQQLALTSAVKAYIREHPADFAATVQTVANLADVAPLEQYTALDAAESFVTGVAEEAASINDNLNPFSAKNRGWVLGVVAIGVILYFAGPAIVAALRAPVKSAK